MNYYAARQRKTDGRWDYTCRNDGYVYPVGFCKPYRNWTDEELERLGINRNSIAKDEELSHLHHADGHETAEEACECYKKYLIERYLRLGIDRKDSQFKCEVCGEFTSMYASIPSQMKEWTLCHEHNTKESVEKLFETPGETWSS